MKQNDRSNSYDAATMRILIQPLLEEEIRKFDEYNRIPYEYSERACKKLRKIFRRDRIYRYSKKAAEGLKILAAGIMVCCTVVTAACAAVGPLRERLAVAAVDWYEEYVALYFYGEEESGEISPLSGEPMYLPDGYVSVLDEVTESGRIIRYVNDAGGRISYSCEPNDGDGMYYDNERHTMEKVEVGGYEGIYFSGAPGSKNMITWAADGYIYSITGEISREELLKMAESVP